MPVLTFSSLVVIIDNLYAVPLLLEQEGLAREVCRHLKLENIEPNNGKWEEMIENIRKIGDNKINVAIVGKYVQLEDSYISVMESLRHAGFVNNVNVDIDLIDCEEVTEENVEKMLGKYHGIIVPGGFGNRGIEGKIQAIKYARENKVPFLGICFMFHLCSKRKATFAPNM